MEGDRLYGFDLFNKLGESIKQGKFDDSDKKIFDNLHTIFQVQIINYSYKHKSELFNSIIINHVIKINLGCLYNILLNLQDKNIIILILKTLGDENNDVYSDMVFFNSNTFLNETLVESIIEISDDEYKQELVLQFIKYGKPDLIIKYLSDVQEIDIGDTDYYMYDFIKLDYVLFKKYIKCINNLNLLLRILISNYKDTYKFKLWLVIDIFKENKYVVGIENINISDFSLLVMNGFDPTKDSYVMHGTEYDNIVPYIISHIAYLKINVETILKNILPKELLCNINSYVNI
jgi:hypothetical protein